ncbi:unnamed protein product [Cuscuta epithymum]|uniref:Uncharacterized protein n=1 Tax=Cuscuta epithymum TaxID=186058 RepID=A0AAV0FFJ3_9ASTE|nr:unnamed protein product [Cuscuta epithymum]
MGSIGDMDAHPPAEKEIPFLKETELERNLWLRSQLVGNDVIIRGRGTHVKLNTIGLQYGTWMLM